MATFPYTSMTDAEREEVGITPGLIRISVGLESIIDIIGDVEQALAKSK